MKRVIFDTNIYGLLLEEKNSQKLKNKISENKEFVIYGFSPIRKELRDVPKSTKLSKKTRILLLELYDYLTEGRFCGNPAEITYLAKRYYVYYRAMGGIHNWESNIKIDFMIVACASYYGLDIVYSADEKTLLSKSALKAYDDVNLQNNLKTPGFLKYDDLIKKFREL